MAEHPVRNPTQRHGLDTLAQRIAGRAGIDHGDAAQPEIIDRRTDRGSEAWSIGPLDLHPEKRVATAEDKIDLRIAVRRPEERLVVRLDGEDLLDDEPLPREAELRVRQQSLHRLDAEQLMEKPAVADVDLRRLHLALGDVGVI